MLAHREHLGEQGLADKRAAQQLDFMWALVRDELAERLRHSAGVAAIREEVRTAVLAGRAAGDHRGRPHARRLRRATG